MIGTGTAGADFQMRVSNIRIFDRTHFIQPSANQRFGNAVGDGKRRPV